MARRVVQRDLLPNERGECTVELPAQATALGVHLDPRGRSVSSVLLPRPKPEPVLVLSALLDDDNRPQARLGDEIHLRSFVVCKPNEPIVEPPDTFLSYVGQIAMTDAHVFERCAVSAAREEAGA